MTPSIAAITLDIQQTGSPVTVTAKQSDTGRRVMISLCDGGFPYPIAPDCYAVLTAQKSDGTILYNHCDIADNAIFYTLTEQTTALPGRLRAEVKLYGANDQLLTGATFRFFIEGSLYPDSRVESADEISALTHLVSEASGVILAGNDMIADGQEMLNTAQQVIREAENARDGANQAAGDATAAAKSANTAAGNAAAAAKNAATAATNASTAADSANEAAKRAQNALETAEEAAQTAARTVQLAQAAVKDAQQAVIGANAAANRATAAAILAENASDAAWEANRKADVLADTVSRLHSEENAIIETAEGSFITLTDAAGRELQGLKIFGRTIRSGIPTPEAPAPLESVGDRGSVNVNLCGRNMLPFPYAFTSRTIGGIEYTVGEDGSVATKGTAEANSVFVLIQDTTTDIVYPKGTYFLSGCPAGGSTSTYSITLRSEMKGDTVQDTGNGALFVLTKAAKLHCTIYFKQGTNADGLVFKPMLSAGSSAMPYERKPLRSLEILTPEGLRGIPVTSGGNCTDENGQQWWCDTVDPETGKLERRTVRAVLDGTHTAPAFAVSGNAHHRIWFDVGEFVKATAIGTSGMCSHLPNTSEAGKTGWFATNASNDAHSYIALTLPDSVAGTTETAVRQWLAANPITVVGGRSDIRYEDLTAEELSQFAALHTHKTHTTVCNDAAAHMEASYVADPKCYIDKKFHQLADALVNS